MSCELFVHVHLHQHFLQLTKAQEPALVNVIGLEAQLEAILVLLEVSSDIHVLYSLAVEDVSEECALVAENHRVQRFELFVCNRLTASGRVCANLLEMQLLVVLEEQWIEIEVEVEQE